MIKLKKSESKILDCEYDGEQFQITIDYPSIEQGDRLASLNSQASKPATNEAYKLMNDKIVEGMSEEETRKITSEAWVKAAYLIDTEKSFIHKRETVKYTLKGLTNTDVPLEFVEKEGGTEISNEQFKELAKDRKLIEYLYYKIAPEIGFTDNDKKKLTGTAIAETKDSLPEENSPSQ